MRKPIERRGVMMKPSTLAIFLVLALVLACTPLSCAKQSQVEPEFTLTLTCESATTSTEGKVAQKLADLIEEHTQGRVKVEVFPAGMLYTSATEWEALTTGGVDVVVTYLYYLTRQLPFLMVTWTEGPWEGPDHANRFYKSPEMAQKMTESLEPLNVRHLALTAGTQRSAYWTDVRELKSRRDFEGLRCAIRAGSAVSAPLVWAKVEPVEVPAAEISMSMQNKVVELVSMDVPTGDAQEWYDFAKHVYVTRAAALGLFVGMNLDTWDSLPADIQEIIANEVLPELQTYAEEEGKRMEDASVEELRGKVETINFETAEQMIAMWEEIKDYPETGVAIKMAGPELMQLIDGLRPSKD